MVPEPGFEPTRPYGQGILSQSTFPIDHNPGHASPCWTVNKLLIQSRFTNSRFMVVDGDNVDCWGEMSHECPTD